MKACIKMPQPRPESDKWSAVHEAVYETSQEYYDTWNWLRSQVRDGVRQITLTHTEASQLLDLIETLADE